MMTVNKFDLEAKIYLSINIYIFTYLYIYTYVFGICVSLGFCGCDHFFPLEGHQLIRYQETWMMLRSNGGRTSNKNRRPPREK